MQLTFSIESIADFEIFDIVDALEKAEGKDTNFYNWLGVSVSVLDMNEWHKILIYEIAFSKSS
jgi:hypothetical protein